MVWVVRILIRGLRVAIWSHVFSSMMNGDFVVVSLSARGGRGRSETVSTPPRAPSTLSSATHCMSAPVASMSFWHSEKSSAEASELPEDAPALPLPALLASSQKVQQQRRASYGEWLRLPHLALTVEEREELTLPPKGPDGGVLQVDYRLTVFHLGRVDTASEMAKIKMGVVLYWTDPRMIGWTSPVLPPTLWGPELYLRNAIDGVSIEYEQFVVANPTEGRMKRIINYEATIIVPMDLHRFPFDIQAISPEWVTISHWRQHDGTRYGSLPQGQSYTLHPVERPDEGNPLLMFFGGGISEWRLEACSTRTSTMKNPAGFTLTVLAVKFHISRKYSYYIAKVIVPLVVLTVTTHLVHLIEPHLLADRIANTFTMFLAAFALLYVVGEHVPHVDFLTTIDRLIFVTLAVLLWVGIESTLVWFVAVHYDGIGMGVAGSGARRGGASGSEDDAADEFGSGVEAFPFPLAYILDASLGGFVLTSYFAYLALMLVPSIHRQAMKRESLEADYEEQLKSDTAEFTFFRRLAPYEVSRKVSTDNFRYSYREMTRRGRHEKKGWGLALGSVEKGEKRDRPSASTTTSMHKATKAAAAKAAQNL